MILTSIAYDLEMNLARAYGETMDRLRDGDWACFLDHDAMFTTYDWCKQLDKAVRLAPPSVGLITACTNRIGNREQVAAGSPVSHDIRAHRVFGEARAKRFGTHLQDAKSLISGVVMCVSKKAWATVEPLPEAFLGVDNVIHTRLRRAGYRVCIMPGLYVYHWYRADGAQHLKGVTSVPKTEIRGAIPRTNRTRSRPGPRRC